MWTELAAFCLVCVLAVATVIGAAAARRTSMVTVRIAGSTALFQDPEVQQELRAHGWNVVVTGFGAKQLETDVPLKQYDIAFAASQNVAQSIAQELDSQGVANDAYIPFQSRMVVATYRSIAELLQKIGIAHLGPGGIWTFNIAAYLNAVQRGIHWQDIPGNKTDSVYANTGRILLSTTDPRFSNEADELIELASYALDHSSAPTSQSAVKRELPLISKCFALQGYMPTGGNTLFSTYLHAGIGAMPLAFVYENHYVGQELADQMGNRKLIKPDMVAMYTDPDILVQNIMIPISRSGEQVSQLFVSDPRLQSLIEQKYGYMNANPGTYQQDMAAHHIAVAGPLADMASAPSGAILQDFLRNIP
jgi:hypothetical protein